MSICVMGEQTHIEHCCPPVLKGSLGDDDARALAELLKVLSDPVRLQIISIIASSPNSEARITDFFALLNRSQPTISHHLTQLVKVGLLEREQQGKCACFRIVRHRLRAIAAAFGGPPCC